MDYQTVLDFWFDELEPKDHFVKNEEVDRNIIERFSDMHEAVCAGELDDWSNEPESALALIIVLDQFSRNMFRGDKKSFSQDEKAQQVAMNAVEKGFDQKISPGQRLFMYMPYMHSESKEIHKAAVLLFEALDNKSSLEYEHIHKDIIDRFGRYPHRNEVMDRESTPEEVEYLNNTSESFF